MNLEEAIAKARELWGERGFARANKHYFRVGVLVMTNMHIKGRSCNSFEQAFEEAASKEDTLEVINTPPQTKSQRMWMKAAQEADSKASRLQETARKLRAGAVLFRRFAEDGEPWPGTKLDDELQNLVAPLEAVEG